MNGVIRRPPTCTVTGFRPRPEPLVLAGVGEGVQLAVAVRGAVGPGEHEGVVGQLCLPRPTAAISGQLPPTQTPCSRGLAGEELRGRAALGLTDPRRHREPGGEGLGEQDELGARADGPAHLGSQPLEVGVPVLPDDVVLHRGDPHAGHPPARPIPPVGTASPSTSSLLQKANRTRCRPRCACSAVVEDAAGDGDDAGALGQRAAEGQAVAVGLHRPDVDRGEVGGLRADHRQAGVAQPPDQHVAAVLQVVRGRGEVRVRQPEPGGDRGLERAAVDVGEELLRGADGGDQGRGPQIQPIFQPVTLNVLPALLTTRVRSRMPGRRRDRARAGRRRTPGARRPRR